MRSYTMDEESWPLLQEEQAYLNENNTGSYDAIFTKTESCRVPKYGSSEQAVEIIPSEKRITYAWNDINVFSNVVAARKLFFKRKKSVDLQSKHILKNTYGVAFPGELFAILGSSGAGKTTLLNTLTFRSPKNLIISGTRWINGVIADKKLLKGQSAYVQQKYLFIGNLTVKEHLIFQALVRMDKGISYAQRMKRVEEVICEFMLTKCQNTHIGIPGRIKGISGGEQKRLAFASEVLTNPSLMFCDEPTSGLDSFMAINVLQVLKSMALSGKTIICTIHQPSSELYSMFDKILLLAEGRTAFLGTPQEADSFFRELEAPCPKNFNPADYFIQLLAIVPGREEACRQAVTMICDRYESSSYGVRKAVYSGSASCSEGSEIWINGEIDKSQYKTTWCAQFKAVLWRSWLIVRKEPLLVKVRLLQTIIVALLIGAIYFDQHIDQDGVMNINGVLFIFLTNMTFQNVFNVISVFCLELPIFLMEHQNGMYRTDVYFLGKTIAELPIFMFLPILFTAVCYYLIGLNGDVSSFFITCGILTLVANVSTSFGYLISCASTSLSMALSIGPPLIMPFLLFGGFFLNINSIPPYFQWLSYISWFKFANEALLINQWKNVSDIPCTTLNSTCPRNGHIVLEIYNFHEGNFIIDIVSLCVLIAAFRLMAYLALLLKTYKHEN